MSDVSVRKLLAALAASWSEATSSRPTEWSPANPALGQCVPSSLVVQDYLGGELGRYHVTGDGIDETHYFNVLDDGAVIDSAISQYQGRGFFRPVAVDLKCYPSIRAKRLADPVTKQRYELLKAKVTSWLAEHPN